MVDNVLSGANLTMCALYIYLAIGPVYGAAGASRIGQAVVLALAVAAIVLGYGRDTGSLTMERRLFPQALGLCSQLLRAAQSTSRREAPVLQCLGLRH